MVEQKKDAETPTISRSGASIDEEAQRIGQAMHGRDTVARNLDVALEEMKAGYARVSMRVGEDMLNGHGTAHGGYSFILADIAFGYACNSHGQMAFAQSAHITYLSFGRPGEMLTAIAQEKSKAGRGAVYDATVYGEDGRIVAEFRGLSRTVKGRVDI